MSSFEALSSLLTKNAIRALDVRESRSSSRGPLASPSTKTSCGVFWPSTIDPCPVAVHASRKDTNRLRSLRNDLAHDGATAQPITKAEAAELVLTSFLSLHYLRALAPHLTAAPGRH